MRDGILRTSFDAKPTKDATVVVDVVNLRIAFIHADTFFSRAWIVGCFDVDAFSRTGGGAEKTSYAFFPAQFIDVQGEPKMIAEKKAKKAKEDKKS